MEKIKKILEQVRGDLGFVLLDILSVNAAYVLALAIRFYMNFEIVESARLFFDTWLQFVPYYTVICIVVFALFNLYGVAWRYVGIEDMNRIVEASMITAVLHMVVTLVFFCRMPISYYVLGAVLQYIFISASRFGYRIFLKEKKKLLHNDSGIPVMVIGAGELARKTIDHLSDTPFQVTALVNKKNAGRKLDGIPVIADYEIALPSVSAVIFADPKMCGEEKKEIVEAAKAAQVEFWDNTRPLASLNSTIPVVSLLQKVKGPVTLVMDGNAWDYASGDAAVESIQNDSYVIDSMKCQKIVLRKPSGSKNSIDETWAKQHEKQTGEEVSFF